jgi:hypothetical protein
MLSGGDGSKERNASRASTGVPDRDCCLGLLITDYHATAPAIREDAQAAAASSYDGSS